MAKEKKVEEVKVVREVTELDVIRKVLADKGICSTHEYDRAKAVLEG